MKGKYRKYITLGLSCAVVGLSIFTLTTGSAVGVTKNWKFGGTAPAAPANIPKPDERYNPKMTTIKVEETFSYEVAMPETKLRGRNVEPEDLELVTADKDQINFMQVECFYYRTVTQKQTRVSSAITCWRTREGLEYWLEDKTRFVDWGPWSEWISR